MGGPPVAELSIGGIVETARSRSRSARLRSLARRAFPAYPAPNLSGRPRGRSRLALGDLVHRGDVGIHQQCDGISHHHARSSGGGIGSVMEVPTSSA